MLQADRHALEESAKRGPEQLNLYANSLHTLIERYRALPAVLALDSELVNALSSPVTPQVQAELNLKLERINGAAQSSTLELLDSTGLAVAASNWNTSNSYVGHNYGFRPYFKQTRSQGAGSFYAVGVTSGIPGYFLSSAVLGPEGQFFGRDGGQAGVPATGTRMEPGQRHAARQRCAGHCIYCQPAQLALSHAPPFE